MPDNPLHDSQSHSQQHRSKVSRSRRTVNGDHHRRPKKPGSPHTSSDHSDSGFFLFIPREETDLAAGLITHHPALEGLVAPEDWIISQSAGNPVTCIGIEKISEHNMQAILLAAADIPHIHGICSEEVVSYDQLNHVDVADVQSQLQADAEAREGRPKFNVIAAALARINGGAPLTVTIEAGLFEGKENLTFSLAPLKDKTFMSIVSELHQAGFVKDEDYTVSNMEIAGAAKSFTFNYEQLAEKPQLIEALKQSVLNIPDDSGPAPRKSGHQPRR